MHHIKRTLGVLFLAALLSGCGGTPTASEEVSEPSTTTFFAMDTVMDLSAYGPQDVLDQAEERVLQLEALFSATDAGSEIYAVNHDGKAVLSQDTAALLSTGLALCQRTQGALDLSIYPLVRAWGFTTGDYRVPEKDELAELVSRIDYGAIGFDEAARSVTLGPNMEIDLGSVAKGYTGDQLSALLRENGVTSALLNLGGNVQAVGTKPDGSPWRIAIKDPMGEGNLGVLEIANQAVITSGGYERYFEENGQTYWHILDPNTGYPAQGGLLSVTIVGDQGVLCDGLSTALFVMGAERAEAFWQASDDFEAVFVAEDGSVSITEGLESSFALLEGYEDVPFTVLRRS